MRVLRGFLVSVLSLGVLAALVALAGREGLLFLGVAHMRNEIDVLRQTAKTPGKYLQDCQRMGVIPSATNQLISEYRLRFTSDTEYVLELVCGQFQSRPITIKSGKLPQFVTKAPGTSGFLWDQVIVSGIVLQVFGRETAVVVSDFQTYTGAPSTLDLGYGPKTSCGGYGYTCCQAESSLGKGKQLTEVLDCPLTCFESCQSRPIILSVTSNPILDMATRTVSVTKGQPVSVSVVLEPGAVGTFTGTIDFGDGTQETFATSTHTQPHTYQCNSQRCSYQVTVTATDSLGAVSAITPISTLTVVVQ